MTDPTRPLAQERDALSRILTRLMDEVSDLESLCKHAPRIVSVAINAARIQAALESTPDEHDALRSALRELTADSDEENTPW